MMTKVLVLILSSVMAAETADNYATADRKNQVVLKNITSRRDDSLTLDKVGSEEKVLYEVAKRFNERNSDVYTTNDGSWIFGLKVRDGTNGSRFENHAYNIYVVAGKTLILRSWSLNDTILSLSIKKGNIVRVNVSFNGSMYKSDVDKRNRLKINITERDLSLILAKVGKEDEGQYEIEESINKGVGDASTREDGAWRFHVNVLESHEILQGSIGERIIILQINKSTTSLPRLYHNDKLVTVLGHDDCDISSKSPFSGRLKCEDDKVMKRYSIEIQNVAQKDAGLYRVNIDDRDTDRCFLNITEKCSTVTSRWTTVNINLSSEGNYDKASTESSSSANTSIMWTVLIYIIPTSSATVVVMMMMMICCHMLHQRRNAHNFEAVRRLILEKCETDSTLRSLQMPPREEELTGDLIHQSNTFHVPIIITSSQRNDFVHGMNDDDGYDSVENAVCMRSTENAKNPVNGDDSSMQEEQEEQNRTGSVEDNYDHINL